MLDVPEVIWGKTKFLDFFFLIGASATKSLEESRIFRYGLLETEHEMAV